MSTPIHQGGAVAGQPPSEWQDYTDLMDRLADHDQTRALAALVGAIGQPSFAARLVTLLCASAQLDQVNVISLDGDEARCLFSWHKARPDMVSQLVGHYVEARMFDRDPALYRLKRRKSAGIRLGMMHRRQIEDDWYRRFFFDDASLGGKLSVLDQGAMRTVYQNFYFATGTDAFLPQEVENLARLAETLSQCILRHTELTTGPAAGPRLPRPEMVSRLLARRAPTLTHREMAVCSRIVTGYTTEAIALDLGIGVNSVATYRKRAYAKLGICSQHALFLLCLDT